MELHRAVLVASSNAPACSAGFVRIDREEVAASGDMASSTAMLHTHKDDVVGKMDMTGRASRNVAHTLPSTIHRLATPNLAPNGPYTALYLPPSCTTGAITARIEAASGVGIGFHGGRIALLIPFAAAETEAGVDQAGPRAEVGVAASHLEMAEVVSRCCAATCSAVPGIVANFLRSCVTPIYRNLFYLNIFSFISI